MCKLSTYIMVLFELTAIFIHHSSAKFVKKRPTGGKGSIMISIDDEADPIYYNKNRLLVIFDINCIDSQINDTIGENIYGFTEDELNIEEHQWLEDNIEFMLETHPDTLSECNIDEYNNYNTTHEINTTLHIEDHEFSFVFFNYKQNNTKDNNNLNMIDYNELCIDYIMYEPIFTLQKDHTCNKIHISNNEKDRKYGLDLITSVNYEQNYLYPETNTSNVDLYILDTGISSSHNEFTHNNVYHISGTGDINGHGTHVTGIVTGHNYGISKKLNIFDYRVCNQDGQCSLRDIFLALDDIKNRLKNN
eukprot:138346_1